MSDTPQEQQQSSSEPKGEEEKELSPLEEDKKDLYDTIKELKPEDANDNIKSKLLALADVHLEYKKVEDEQYNIEYDNLQSKYESLFLMKNRGFISSNFFISSVYPANITHRLSLLSSSQSFSKPSLIKSNNVLLLTLERSKGAIQKLLNE